jgi:hypothetical protein
MPRTREQRIEASKARNRERGITEADVHALRGRQANVVKVCREAAAGPRYAGGEDRWGGPTPPGDDAA